MIYYCKKCNYKIGSFTHYECNSTQSANINSIYFLDCKNCNKFIGIICYFVCENCLGKDEIFGEENLFNWFLEYKKLQLKYINHEFICKFCNNDDFRCQYWFFKELTFYK